MTIARCHATKASKPTSAGVRYVCHLQSLARMGAAVIGIDLAQKSVDVATQHAKGDTSISGRLTYRTASAEQLLAEGDCDNSYTVSI